MARQSNQDPGKMRRQMGSFLSRAANAIGGLKDVVVRNSQIGKIKLDTSALRRERDLALQRLGAAYFDALEGAVEGAEHPLPEEAGMQQLVDRIRALDQELEQQATELAAVEAEAAMNQAATRVASQAALEAEAALADDKYETWAEAAAPSADELERSAEGAAPPADASEEAAAPAAEKKAGA